MLPIDSFSHVFPFGDKFTYPDTLRKSIDQRRRHLDGRLFIDALFAQLGIQIDKASASYPPTSHASLRALHNNIVTRPISLHYKQCLMYYLLLDIESSIEALPQTSTSASSLQRTSRHTRHGNESSTSSHTLSNHPAESFLAAVHLPRKYQLVMLGLWSMDHADYRKGIELLSSPALMAVFPEMVLSCLLKAGVGTQEAAYTLGGASREEIRGLVVGYWYAKAGDLKKSAEGDDGGQDVQQRMFDFLCEGGIRDGYAFYRRHFAASTGAEGEAESKKEWFQRLTQHALDPSSLQSDAAMDASGASVRGSTQQHNVRKSTRTGRTHTRSESKQIPTNNTRGTTQPRAAAGIALIDLPLSTQEGTWLEEYLSAEGDGRDLPFANDTLILRGVVTGRPITSKSSGKAVDGLSWDTVTSGLRSQTVEAYKFD